MAACLPLPDMDGVIRVWDTKAGQPLARLQSDASGYEAAGFTADGSALFALASGGSFHVWDVATWKMRQPIQGQGGKLAGAGKPPGWSSAPTPAC